MAIFLGIIWDICIYRKSVFLIFELDVAYVSNSRHFLGVSHAKGKPY